MGECYFGVMRHSSSCDKAVICSATAHLRISDPPVILARAKAVTLLALPHILLCCDFYTAHKATVVTVCADSARSAPGPV